MIALAAALLCAATPEPGPRDVQAASEAIRFGDWLTERGDHYRAIGEYERALFLDPGAGAAPAVELRIARAYVAGGKDEAAARILRRLAAEAKDPAVRDAALFEVGLAGYRAGDPEAAATALEAYSGLAAPAGGPGPERARLLLSLALVRAGDGERARLALAPLAAAGGEGADVSAVLAGIAEVQGAPRRSALAAGLLSAAVPGLGHAYAGDPRGALGALALNGLFVWATVDAFRDRRYGLGALLLAGESIWYGGAIFGAVAEALRFNRDAREIALARLEGRVRWVIEPVPGGAAVGVRGPLGGSGRD